MNNEKSQPATPPRGDIERSPLFGIKGAIIVAIALGVVAGLLVIAYYIGNPQRYISKLQVTVDNVAPRDFKKGASEITPPSAVEVVGTIKNTGSRDVRQAVLEVVLKDKNDRTVGVCRQGGGRWNRTFQVGAHSTTTFHIEVEPVSDDWVPDKTVARVVEISFGTPMD
jgi:hypothetical protein